ncbi:hypothetical protein MUO66_08385, partial [Candidatus Bathyarchaeota archaeon]|nr:hypothetical protein [Candidatus Bathyarchaeota archaeon]
TWSWSDSTWTKLSPATSPSSRSGASMGLDLITRQLILFGGNNTSGYLNDSWNWDGSTWSSVPLSSSPTGISMLKMYINGLSAGDAGYVRHALSTTRYYLIEVTYSYDLVAETTPFTIDFNYTPFPYDSFINVEPLPTVLGI